MYTDGLQIGDNAYLLQNKDKLVLTTISGTPEQMEEYINLKNEHEKRRKRYFELNNILLETKNFDKKSKQLRNKFLVAGTVIEGGFILVGTGLSALNYPYALELLISIGVILFGISMTTPTLIYGTKKKRKRIIKKTNEHIEIEINEINKIVEKLQTLEKKIESETLINKKEECIIPITTVENKKANIKMRLLKLNQSR